MKLIQYIKGLRKGKDAHRIEREAMTDPFLSDALDGFDSVDGNHAERIDRIQRQLALRNEHKHSIAAAKVSSKQRKLQEAEAESSEYLPSVDECATEERIFTTPNVQHPVGSQKKKRRSMVWAAAAILLLLITTGGYFWLSDEKSTPTSQLALTTTKDIPASKESASTVEDESSLLDYAELSEQAEEKAVLAQNRQAERVVKQQSSEAAAAATPLPSAQIAEEAIVIADAKIVEDTYLSAEQEVEAFMDFNKLKLDDSTSNLLAYKEEAKTSQIAASAVKVDGIGIYSNTNRHALTQSQGKISGKLSDQSQSSSFKRSKKDKALSTADYSSSAVVASGSVKGRVVDQNGEPLPFATVQVKGTTTATTTDMEGYFALNAQNAEKLVASYIGFEPVELTADTSKPMTIAMNEDAALLEETVVVAYGVATEDNDSWYDSPTTPKPEAGHNAYRNYISNNLRIPTDGCASVKGRVVLNFYVSSSGRPYGIEVRRSLCPSADQEAIRLIEEGGNWTTGEGQVRYSIKF